MPVKNPCSICKFSVHNNHKAILCDICHFWTHLKCSSFSHNEYIALSNSPEPWFCSSCIISLFPFNHFEDDTDFYFSLFDFTSDSFNTELLKDKYFNPFLDDPQSRHLLLNSDIDPDSNVFTKNSQLLSNCIYLTSNEFNKISTSSSNIFSLFHVNIRSLSKNFADFSEFISTLNISFSSIGVSETWLRDFNENLYSIPGYCFISNTRQHKSGGGVGLFIKSDLKFKLRTDLQSPNNKLYESIFAEILQPNSKNIIVGCIYKPPDTSVSDFNNSINNILSTISFENKLTYLMGDFNINILNAESHQPTEDFINLMTSNCLYPLISKPTRITHSTATLIDNIFTNNLEFNMVSGIIYSDISDHLPVFQITQFKLVFEPPPPRKHIRLINPQNILKFRSKLAEIDWSFLQNLDSVNNCYDAFYNRLNSAYKQSFPLKVINSEIQRPFKPWFSAGLRMSCKRKNSLYKQYILSPTLTNKSRYCKFRNKYYFLIKLARKQYFHDKLISVNSNLKKTWSIIKQVISKKKAEQNFITMKDSNGTYSDPAQIANKFNTFFTNIGPSLAKDIPSVHLSYKHFLAGCYDSSFFLSPTCPSEISSIVCSLKNSNSVGFDDICIKPIKDSIDLLASPLSFICNLSFSSGVFPDKLKIAKVLPIFKNDDSSHFSNYRPISILPCFSKVLEKLFYSRLSDFLVKFNILNNHQYGFRQHYSTFMAVLELVNNIFQGFENNEYTVGIFIDIKKAFDTVNHRILIDKLRFYGIRGTPLAWISSYLSNRQQYVQVHGFDSSYNSIKCGVPQGSVLGPLLFIIYINDLFNSANSLSFILFADDTNIFFRHKSIFTLLDTVNRELSLVSLWFNANKLTLHPSKTKFILFHPSRKNINPDDMHIFINRTPISRVTSTKFLGVIIHENLSWKPHITAICAKVSKITGIICKSRQYLTSNTLQTLYNSLFLPYINYCNIIWASTFTSHLEPLYLIQKKIVRIISFSSPRTHTKPLFLKLKFLPVHSIFKFQISCFVFSHINNLLPTPLSSLFFFNYEHHDYSTRSKFNLHKYFLRYHFSVRSQAPTIWNNIPLSLRNSLTVSNYRRKLKMFFLESILCH